MDQCCHECGSFLIDFIGLVVIPGSSAPVAKYHCMNCGLDFILDEILNDV